MSAVTDVVCTGSTEITLSTHAYCAYCTAPVLGQPVVALCGSSKVYTGVKPVSADGCSVCEDIAGRRTLPCGHRGEGE